MITRKGFFATIGAALFGAKVAPAAIKTPTLNGFNVGPTIFVPLPHRYLMEMNIHIAGAMKQLADDIDRSAAQWAYDRPRRQKRPHLYPFATRFDPKRLPL